MSEISQLPFYVANVIAVIAELLILVGAIIFLVKKKSIPAWIMVLSSAMILLMMVIRPIVMYFYGDVLPDTTDIFLLQGIMSILTTLFSLAFAIGFIWAMTKLKKAE